MTNTCKNCETLLETKDQFCSQCGQSTKTHQRPFFPFITNSLHELFDIDGRLGLTIKTLIFKPGKLSYDYSQGKRVKYTPALRIYLVISVLFFLLFSVFQGENNNAIQSNLDLYPKIMFLLFPFFALLTNCFYKTSYYLDNIVFSMHIHSIAYLLLAIVGPLEKFEQEHIGFTLLQVPAIVYFAWYFFTAFKIMYQESWWHTLLKTFAIYFLYMATLGLVFDQLL